MEKEKTNVRQIRNASAPNATRTRSKAEPKKPKESKMSASSPRVRFLFVPYVEQMRNKMKKNFEKDVAQMWIPIESSLLIRYEFAACSIQTRYVFVAIVLHCAARGIDEIPTDTRFLASVLNADERTISKSLIELENGKMLLERKREEKEKKENTDRQTDENGVCVDSQNLFSDEEKTENENGLLKKVSSNGDSNKKHLSQFSIEDCLRYVEHCQSKGDEIKNAKALARNLFQTGEADAFIMNTLHPESVSARDLITFGLPIGFSDAPCSVCFGAKMADVDGKGFRACEHCKNEKKKSTGFEPEGANSDD